MTPFAIAGLQLELPNGPDNFATIAARIETTLAAFPFVQMFVASELATFGSNPAHAQPLPGPVEDAYRALAAKHRIWLVPGSFNEKLDGKIYNTAPVIDPRGEVVLRHRKLFPFLPHETGIASGQELGVFDIPGIGRFGVLICYDMWFPETVRALAMLGAEVILHPSLTPPIDRDVELAIVRANAATNQCYFVDINGAGELGNGRSIVCGPFGDVIYQAGDRHQVFPVELDLDVVRAARARGSHGLGQPLKSFRDRAIDFSIYREPSPYLHSLGPLEKPRGPNT